MNIITKTLALALAISSITSCSYGNLDDIKASARQKFDDLGFEITGYNGYTIGFGG